jgi:hypothetical protein
VNRRHASVEEEGVAGSGASHRYGTIGDQTLSVGVLFFATAKFGSHVMYIGACDGAHCPLD